MWRCDQVSVCKRSHSDSIYRSRLHSAYYNTTTTALPSADKSCPSSRLVMVLKHGIANLSIRWNLTPNSSPNSFTTWESLHLLHSMMSCPSTTLSSSLSFRARYTRWFWFSEPQKHTRGTRRRKKRRGRNMLALVRRSLSYGTGRRFTTPAVYMASCMECQMGLLEHSLVSGFPDTGNISSLRRVFRCRG